MDIQAVAEQYPLVPLPVGTEPISARDVDHETRAKVTALMRRLESGHLERELSVLGSRSGFQLLRLVAEKDRLSVKELAQLAHIGSSQASKSLTAAREAGLVEARTVNGQKLHSLTPRGQQLLDVLLHGWEQLDKLAVKGASSQAGEATPTAD